MTDPYKYPKLRWPLDLSTHWVDKEEVLVISDPLGVGEKQLVLKAAAAPLLATFTGEASTSHIAAQFREQGVSEQLLKELVKLLDDHFFLATPKFFQEEQRVLKQFMDSPVRAAALSGKVYPSDPAQLSSQIASYLSSAPRSNGNGTLLGLAAPHIDYNRGKSSYAAGYANFDLNPDTTILLIGPSHQPHRGDFHLTLKDSSTPLGSIPCDRDLVRDIAVAFGPQSFAEELLHRTEHSLELQLPFIQFAAFHRKSTGVRLVPILLGSFNQYLAQGREPKGQDQYEMFIGALVKAVANSMKAGRSFVVVAGVDMAHVGAEFGDRESLSEQFMQRVAERDQLYLRTIQTQNRRALFEHIAEDMNGRRVCGFSSMYTTIDLFDRLNLRYTAEIFDYSQAVDVQRGCGVTFASLGFYRDGMVF